jgi:hypothetical protein
MEAAATDRTFNDMHEVIGQSMQDNEATTLALSLHIECRTHQ